MKKNKNNIPGNVIPAPAKAETKNTSVNHIVRNKRKEIESRNRARRIRSLMKQGLSKEEIEQWFKNDAKRLILVLAYDSFCVKNGTKTKKVFVKDEKHRVTGVEEKEVDINLYGINALKKFCEDNKLSLIASHKGTYGHAGWILSDKDNIDKVIELLKPVGRTSVTKPENPISKPVETKKEKKSTNNTADVKKVAKTRRKESKVKATEMRAYYAALRKGGVNARIKKHNPTLAKKIEDWLKDHKKKEIEKAENNKEHRAKHRQLTSLEVKANKRARKAAKHIATHERMIAAQKKQAEANAKIRAQRPQKSKKPVQTEIKEAA